MTNTDICPFCETIVKTCDKAMCCDLCSKLIHIKYNNLNDLDYEYLDYKVRMNVALSNLYSGNFTILQQENKSKLN